MRLLLVGGNAREVSTSGEMELRPVGHSGQERPPARNKCWCHET
jgi:hypothetical protein